MPEDHQNIIPLGTGKWRFLLERLGPQDAASVNVTKTHVIIMNWNYAVPPDTYVILNEKKDKPWSYGLSVDLIKQMNTPNSRWTMHEFVNGVPGDARFKGNSTMCGDLKGKTLPGKLFGYHLFKRECPITKGVYYMNDFIPSLDDLPKGTNGKWRLTYGWLEGKLIYFRYYLDIVIDRS